MIALLPGLAIYVYGRGPRVDAGESSDPPDLSIAEAAVLRDGAVGATRWAFAALVCRLARDGHCTLVRTRKRRWMRTGPALTVDLHADPTTLTAFEQSVLRQLGRHDTLDGFGFAGSTFRRRTLRDVRARLVERGWLVDRRRRSNVLLGLAFVLAGAGIVATLQGWAAGIVTLLFGGAIGSAIGGIPRTSVTETGAHRRAAHRAYAERQRDRIRMHLSDRPEDAWETLVEALPHLVLERIATPRWLTAVADQFETTGTEGPAPDWIRDEIDGTSSESEAVRTLARVLQAMGARSPLPERLTGPRRAP